MAYDTLDHFSLPGCVSALVIAVDRPLALISYFKAGRLSSRESVMTAKNRGEENPGKKKPFWQIVGVGATHCGSACNLGDLVASGSPLRHLW